MSDSDKLAAVQALIPDVTVTDAQITTYLTLAQQRILQALYPFGGAPSSLPEQYDAIQCELAVRYIAKRGAEGETRHSENGTSRAYGSVDDADIISRLVPYAGVI